MAWDVGLHRSFDCGGRQVWVSLASMRGADGQLQFDVHWLPGPPERLPSDTIEQFDKAKREAIAAICAHLEALQ